MTTSKFGVDAVSEIRFVCISDTHFGAENSVLSHVRSGESKVDPLTHGPVLEALVACLGELVNSPRGRAKPVLILNGDILEMALAQDNVAAMVFDNFIELAFGGSEPIFDRTIVYVPGNHDHHVWETARERQYAEYVSTVTGQCEIEPPWHVTRLFPRDDAPPPESELLTALVNRRTGGDAVVRVVYPNFAFESPDRARIAIFHHGHFVEPLYRLMSLARSALFPNQPIGREIWDWEGDNFAWIDFFWSTLGRSGEAGEDVGLIYDMLQDERALGALCGNLGGALGNRVPSAVRPAARCAASLALRRLARLARSRERSNPNVLLSASADAGLDSYLEEPLLRQLNRERTSGADRKVHFVFGHTHKPFEATRQVRGFGQAVSIVNTGGWVVDTEIPAALQGASVVVVDEECHVETLRIYNQANGAADYRVQFAPITDATPSPLRLELEDRLSLEDPPWSDLSSSLAEAVGQRHELLPRLVRSGLQLAGASERQNT